jgi:TonB family protein
MSYLVALTKKLKMKFLFLVLVSFFVLTQSFAQKQNVYFLKNDGREVKLKDSADFIRIIQEPDSGSNNFKVLEYYPDNSRKFIGEASMYEPLVYQGPSIRFNKNGRKSEQISYLNSAPTGIAYYYYPNGRVKKVLYYKTEEMIDFRVISYFDSTGVQTVNNGNGSVVITDKEGILREEGKYLDGLQDSTWKCYYQEKGRYYEEVYKKGELISGVQTLSNGSRLNYSQIEEEPQFKGGAEQFSSFVASNFHYPEDARKSGIQGIMVINFIVNPDGEISDIKIYRPLSNSITHAAISALNKSPKWTPGKLRGVPFSRGCTLPLSLNLSDNYIYEIDPRQIPRRSNYPQRGVF